YVFISPAERRDGDKDFDSPLLKGGNRLVVRAGSDVVLPCSFSTKNNIEPIRFVWRKNGRQEVFLYDAGNHYNNGRQGQDEQFKGRVSHFPDELINGNASIIIRNTRQSDSGNYTCDFLHIHQRFHIELLVGVSPRPITTLHERSDGVLLQCEVLGASPKPVVEWWDSDGNILPAHQPTITERGGNKYDVILNATVTKSGDYRCVSTQKEIYSQIYTETYAPGPGEFYLNIFLLTVS
ncbi:CD276 antigen-like, partial [Stegastes partitus]|uniref:CD276 antigen-like n=1 Tax=Stegastes partitus TaxID=144197 RepID=A0A9Y4NX26_9TELE